MTTPTTKNRLNKEFYKNLVYLIQNIQNEKDLVLLESFIINH